MKGKKKGGLATRLARMSDEERTKYLQRKADAEEEARRRKEQLVAYFMKNKLKKEDAFSRLNVAKINQQWHQIMRADKCDSMRRDLEHLKKWITKTISIKNNTIKKLVNELDWQENLYGKNFDAHSKHIDNLIEFHNKHLEKLSNQYKKDKKLLLHVGSTEKNAIDDRSTKEIEHLKTVIYGQTVVCEKEKSNVREFYSNQIIEASSDYKMEIRQMQKEREKIIGALWKQLSNVVLAYIQQTELKRLHFTELQNLDNAASQQITQNNQEISKQEDEIRKLQKEYDKLFSTQEEEIEQLEDIVKSITREFFRLRKALTRDLNRDEKQLACLSTASNASIEYLVAIRTKGKHVLHLARSCEKLENENEKARYWQTFTEGAFEAQRTTLPYLTKIRPKTSLVTRPPQLKTIRNVKSEEYHKSDYEPTETFTIKTRLIKRPIKEDSITIEKKVLDNKQTKFDLITPQSKQVVLSDESSETIPKSGLSHLNKLEGLWLVYNKVQLECNDLKNEKKRILQKNQKLKEDIRKILEASALGHSVRYSRRGSTASSKRRFTSAPVSSTVPVINLM